MFPIATTTSLAMHSTAVSVLEALRGGSQQAATTAATTTAIYTTTATIDASSTAPATTNPPPRSRGINLNKLYQDFYKLNEVVRFFVSGNVGSIIFFALERMVYLVLVNNVDALPKLIVEYKDSASFLMAYALQIWTQHWLHAFLVYGMHTISTREKYIKTLIACYTTYAGSAVGSTLLQTLFVRNGVNRSLAFVLTLWSFAVLNFFILKYLNDRVAKAAAAHDADHKRNDDNRENSGITETVQVIRGGGFVVGDDDVHNFVLSVGTPVVLKDE